MRRLLDDFHQVFDPDHRVAGARLGDLVEAVLDAVEVPAMPEFGTEGAAEKVAAKSDRFVRFYYRPHLFPGMEMELRLAHQLQFHLLPRSLPEGAPVSVAAVLESYCHLSGDVFGWEELRDGGFLLWIVDMAGHGVRSGLYAAVLKILIDRARERSQVARLAAEINRSLSASMRDPYAPYYATGFFLALRPDGSGSYCSAAHPPALLRRRDGTLQDLPSLSRPLGLIEESTYESRELRLERGDALLLYTDGLVETKSREGEELGIERVRRLFASEFEAPEDMTGSIYRELASRQDLPQLEDDVTFLVARFD
jgi:sigma-B regulation protein RsbU (phosphoserine phosphatase)